MPSLVANGRAIGRAINGPPAMYAIKRHDRLYLDVRGEGRAAWRIRYRPKPNANQRWFTLAGAATHADFEEVERKAGELLTALRLYGTDPHAQKAKAASARPTLANCFQLWLDHTGNRGKQPLSPGTRAGYQNLFKLHVQPHLGKRCVLSDL